MRQNKLYLTIFTCGLIFLTGQAESATIKGTVRYEGDVPKFKEIRMDADPICLTHHSQPVYPQSLVLGENKAMANVFVHITQGILEKDYPISSEEVILDQKGCLYEPHVVGVRIGQSMKILNPDGTLHNVHAKAKVNEEFNVAMPKFRKEISKTFDKAEFMFSIKCDVHPWMLAWVAVMPHPYFAVTKTDGRYVIADLPPGEYEIEVWHERLGTQTRKVSLVEAETKEIDFTFLPPVSQK